MNNVKITPWRESAQAPYTDCLEDLRGGHLSSTLIPLRTKTQALSPFEYDFEPDSLLDTYLDV